MLEPLWLKSFKWESQEQKDGYLALVKWLKDKGIGTDDISPTDLFFMQKDVEAHKWHIENLSNQVQMLQNAIVALRKDLQDLKKASSTKTAVRRA